jgi:hypothetical protein
MSPGCTGRWKISASSTPLSASIPSSAKSSHWHTLDLKPHLLPRCLLAAQAGEDFSVISTPLDAKRINTIQP